MFVYLVCTLPKVGLKIVLCVFCIEIRVCNHCICIVVYHSVARLCVHVVCHISGSLALFLKVILNVWLISC